MTTSFCKHFGDRSEQKTQEQLIKLEDEILKLNVYISLLAISNIILLGMIIL